MRRLLIEVLLPPLFAGLLLIVPVFFRSTASAGAWPAFLKPLLEIYLVGMALSVPYAALMEVSFARGLRPGSLASVAVSTGLGATMGLLLGVALWCLLCPALCVLGAMVGLIVGSILVAVERIARSRASGRAV